MIEMGKTEKLLMIALSVIVIIGVISAWFSESEPVNTKWEEGDVVCTKIGNYKGYVYGETVSMDNEYKVRLYVRNAVVDKWPSEDGIKESKPFYDAWIKNYELKDCDSDD
jgi:hypothetical protein